VSTIGYAETASVLSALAGIPIPVNRVQIRMEPGDEALVFRVVLPPGSPRLDPQNKGQIAALIAAQAWEIGVLRRLA
jgi:hypothetical protein